MPIKQEDITPLVLRCVRVKVQAWVATCITGKDAEYLALRSVPLPESERPQAAIQALRKAIEAAEQAIAMIERGEMRHDR